jgi:hypothetical protein
MQHLHRLQILKACGYLPPKAEAHCTRITVIRLYLLLATPQEVARLAMFLLYPSLLGTERLHYEVDKCLWAWGSISKGMTRCKQNVLIMS